MSGGVISPAKSISRAKKRTVKLQKLPLSTHKRTQIDEMLHIYRAVKDRFQVELAPARTWEFPDSKQDFRNAMKWAGAYPDDVNIHLVDQAAIAACTIACLRNATDLSPDCTRASLSGRKSKEVASTDNFVYTVVPIATQL